MPWKLVWSPAVACESLATFEQSSSVEVRERVREIQLSKLLLDRVRPQLDVAKCNDRKMLSI
jgi:hypothetical protein